MKLINRRWLPRKERQIDSPTAIHPSDPDIMLGSAVFELIQSRFGPFDENLRVRTGTSTEEYDFQFTIVRFIEPHRITMSKFLDCHNCVDVLRVTGTVYSDTDVVIEERYGLHYIFADTCVGGVA